MVFIIGLIFCFGFFIESIVGFGGTLVAFAILGFFFDIKDLILVAIFIATTASIFVIASDFKSFNKNIFFKSFPLCLIGNFIGTTFFIYSSAEFILKLFGILLLFLAFKTIFFDNIKIPKNFSNLILTIGGISQGLFGIGGPFFAIAIKNYFQNKSELRATLASFFITFNLIRTCQFSLQNSLDSEIFLRYWWIASPLAIAIYLGHLIHKKIDEKKFKFSVAALCLFSGIKFLV